MSFRPRAPEARASASFATSAKKDSISKNRSFGLPKLDRLLAMVRLPLSRHPPDPFRSMEETLAEGAFAFAGSRLVPTVRMWYFLLCSPT